MSRFAVNQAQPIQGCGWVSTSIWWSCGKRATRLPSQWHPLSQLSIEWPGLRLRIILKTIHTDFYIITQVILAFWLVLAYDLLEDRRTIDVIITKFFPPCLKVAESFENFKKSIVDALNRYEKHSLATRRKIKPFHFQKMTQKKYSSSLSRQ